MKMTAVTSSNIASVGYDKIKELHVEFKTGARYSFMDIAPDLFDQFSKAESKGKFFAENIKGKFETTKIKEAKKKKIKEEK